MSVIEPSVVTSIPIVECSSITFFVPISAAVSNGISSSDQGVFTILGISSSKYPIALSTKYPTQSTSLVLNFKLLSNVISIASLGTNFGSVVIIVFPPALCGNSSFALSFLYSLSILGITSKSINFFINVDFPVRTGPTTPT
jgi:hypothetical protein